MLPTKLIKKGCIISFISLLLLAAVLYFVVYKTLVLESFEDEDDPPREPPSTREWGRTVLSAGLNPKVPGTDGNRPAFEAALQFGKESIDGTSCGNEQKRFIQEDTCSNIANEAECNTMMRVKKKIKGRGAHDGMVDDDFAVDSLGNVAVDASGIPLMGNGLGYDLNDMRNDIEYRLNYNVYPCKWVDLGGGVGGAGVGECTNDLHNRCVFMGEDSWNAGGGKDMEKTNILGTHSYTYSDIEKVIKCAENPGLPGCPDDNNQAG
tara:strand:- start:2563 stop:3354 length:792 start_codon:yes stop_codon:yes gene_type:complete